MTLTELFDHATSRKASDIHLASGEPLRLRIGGNLVPIETVVDPTELLEPFLTPGGSARLGAGLAVERTVVHGDSAFVGIAFRTDDEGLVATFRILPKAATPFERIMEGAESFFRGLVETKRGLVLVVGPTGSGKWTTASAIVEAINTDREARIFVATTYPSFPFESKRSMVTSVRVGIGESVGGVLRTLAQADPDVLATDDLPTHEDLRQALSLAEFGHLVIANLDAVSPAQAIERLLDSAGDEAPALRRALAENLVAITGQRLVPRVGGGKAPVYEWMTMSPGVKEALLSEGDLAQVQSEDPNCRTRGRTARDLYQKGRISFEDAAELSKEMGSLNDLAVEI